jgi:hypothetical protein
MGVMAALGAAVMLGGCATGYQKMGLTGGYDEVRLAPDLYRVSVQGNGYTTPARAEKIMLLRAAELALQNGYPKFIVENREGHSDQQLVYTGIYTGYSTIARPRAAMVVRLIKANDPRASTAYDARIIQADLRPKLVPDDAPASAPPKS